MKLKKRIVPVGKKVYEVYLVRKIHEILSKKTSKREKIPSRGLYFDTINWISILIRGYNYYLLYIDNITYYIWVALFKTLYTKEVLLYIKEIVSWVHTFIGNKVAWIKADNGKGEFGHKFQNELISRGIDFEPCPLYKHSYNSVIERIIYIVDYKIRSLLFKGNILVEL